MFILMNRDSHHLLHIFFFHTVIEEGIYLIKSTIYGRYMLQTGNPFSYRGVEGGWSNSPKVVGSDANYENRANWRITQVFSETLAIYLIKNIVTQRYLFQAGGVIGSYRGAEGGWGNSPKVVGSDANYYNRAYWKILPLSSGNYFIENSEFRRYTFQTGETYSGNRGDEGGWSDSPKIVGSDANYYHRAQFSLLRKEFCSRNSQCGTYATCTNTEGYFICTCNSGFSGDGSTCRGKTCRMAFSCSIIIIN